jgi:outer membrane protein assembly factor BamD (BamD/ComL family)
LKSTLYCMMTLAVGVLIFSCSSGSNSLKNEQTLYTEAQNFSEKGDFQSAIKTYEDILKLYPDSPRAYKAQFLIAFVYSENLKDYENAKINYQKLIEKYPNCDLVDDAQYMLRTMENDTLPVAPDEGETPSD